MFYSEPAAVLAATSIYPLLILTRSPSLLLALFIPSCPVLEASAFSSSPIVFASDCLLKFPLLVQSFPETVVRRKRTILLLPTFHCWRAQKLTPNRYCTQIKSSLIPAYHTPSCYCTVATKLVHNNTAYYRAPSTCGVFFHKDKQQIDLCHIFHGMQFFILYCIKYMAKSYLLHLLEKKFHKIAHRFAVCVAKFMLQVRTS